MTTVSGGLIALDGETLADAIPMDFRIWDPGEDVSVRPMLADGWRGFVAELASAVNLRSSWDPRTARLRHLGQGIQTALNGQSA